MQVDRHLSFSVDIQPKKPVIDPVTCMVCFEDVERSDIITFNGKSHDICPNCFAEYLETQIKENKVRSAYCNLMISMGTCYIGIEDYLPALF